jgi:hypothetical protein
VKMRRGSLRKKESPTDKMTCTDRHKKREAENNNNTANHMEGGKKVRNR